MVTKSIELSLWLACCSKECRVAKVRCLWTADSADTDARCSRCREKNRPCTKWINSSGVVPVDGAEDSLEGLLKQRRARWACIGR